MDRRSPASAAMATVRPAAAACVNSACARFQRRWAPRMTELALDGSRTPEPPRRSVRAAGQTDTMFPLPVSVPLVLDLDGTLIAGDLLYKSFFSILRRTPLIVFPCAAWLLKGRAALQRELALRNRLECERREL